MEFLGLPSTIQLIGSFDTKDHARRRTKISQTLQRYSVSSSSTPAHRPISSPTNKIFFIICCYCLGKIVFLQMQKYLTVVVVVVVKVKEKEQQQHKKKKLYAKKKKHNFHFISLYFIIFLFNLFAIFSALLLLVLCFILLLLPCFPKQKEEKNSNLYCSFCFASYFLWCFYFVLLRGWGNWRVVWIRK